MKTIYHPGEKLTAEVILGGGEEHIVAIQGLTRFRERSRSEFADDNLERLVDELKVSQSRESRGLPALNFVGDDAQLIGRAIEKVAEITDGTDPLANYKPAAHFMLDNEVVVGLQMDDAPFPMTVAA